MDAAFFGITLLTGFLVSTTSSSVEFFFINEPMIWNKAFDYCFEKYRGMAQILNREAASALMGTEPREHTGSAWIGLFENYSSWNWIDGLQPTFFNWMPEHVIKGTELCVSMKQDGTWISNVCTEAKPALCDGGEYSFSLIKSSQNWTDAVSKCEEQGSLLAKIANAESNAEATKELWMETWIGLSRAPLWYWSETSDVLGNYHKWDVGEPVSPKKSPLPNEQSCAAVSLSSGNWSRQPCSTKYPFFCYKETELRVEVPSPAYPTEAEEKTLEMQWTLVRITFQSSANMADPAIRARLKRQLHLAVSKNTSDIIKTTWHKLPEKLEEKAAVKETC